MSEVEVEVQAPMSDADYWMGETLGLVVRPEEVSKEMGRIAGEKDKYGNRGPAK